MVIKKKMSQLKVITQPVLRFSKLIQSTMLMLLVNFFYRCWMVQGWGGDGNNVPAL